MKPILLLLPCLLFVGCGKQNEVSREALSKLDGLKAQLETVKTDLTAHQSQPVRWATANKRQIESAISEWSRVKAEEAKSKETLTPEQIDLVHKYEALSSEQMQKRMAQHRFPGMMQNGVPNTAESDKDYQALSEKVEAARTPIAEILQRRTQIYSQVNNQFKPEQLIAEYVKDRFDLVVDASEMSFNSSSVLYSHSGEALDITEGVIKLFRDKTAK